MNISIRKYKSTDATQFYQAVIESVDHVSRWLPLCTENYSFSDAQDWCNSALTAWENDTDYRFIIEDNDTRAILGSVGFNQIVKQHKIANLGYWIRKSTAGKGVCTTACRLAIDYAFSKLDIYRIEIHVHPENTASNTVASKLGVYEGTFRNKLVLHGKSVAAKCYSVISGDI